jgi:hypothetical protein
MSTTPRNVSPTRSRSGPTARVDPRPRPGPGRARISDPRDGQERRTHRRLDRMGQPVRPGGAGRQAPSLTLTADPEMSESTFGVGDTIDVQHVRPDGGRRGRHGRYLFTTAQRGLRDVAVGLSASERHSVGRPSGLSIDAVRFNGSRYSRPARSRPTSTWPTERSLSVCRRTPLATHRARTSGSRSRPATSPAIPSLRRRPAAVDEKLFTLGGAAADDASAGSMRASIGHRVIYRSHRSPRAQEDNGRRHDGGGRDDFRDSLLFTSVETGSTVGRASRCTYPTISRRGVSAPPRWCRTHRR